MKYLKKLEVKLVKGEYKNLIKNQISKSDDIFKLFQSIKDFAHETLIVIYLDSDLKSLVYNVLSTGTQNSTIVDLNDVLSYGFLLKAKYFILVHNHPNGQSQPSDNDLKIIDECVGYCKFPVKLKFLDFIIVGDKDLDKNQNFFWSWFDDQDGGEYELGAIA
jgi:DNA repair protein RadC